MIYSARSDLSTDHNSQGHTFPNMKLTFHGAAGMVTGSNFLLEEDGLKVMIDCGLTQGTKDAEARNWHPFPYEPSGIDFLIVTHAHIDHIGRIPKLARDGFKGQIISTEATRTLAEPMLMDSMELLKMAAERHGRDVLYDERHVVAALQLWRGVSYHEEVALANNLSFQFLHAGHILGAGMVSLQRGGRKVIFTGDLGSHSDLLEPAESPQGAQYLVMESVYGDRTHNEGEHHRDALQHIIVDTHQRGGTLLIPAFSTERTQDILYDIRSLMHDGKIPSMPVFLDSPLAIKVTRAFIEHGEFFAEDIARRVEGGEDIFSFPELRYVESAKESHHIEKTPDPKIIIAGSGMSSGGRVLAHEKNVLGDKNSTLCIVGYQSAGSIGRRLMDGEKSIEILGERVRVRARIERILSYSAHKDSPELIEFASSGSETLESVFLVMGEPAASSYLAQRLRDYAGLKAQVPQAGESVQINI
jgi:metallo-beta-lactamase family protein